MKIDEYTIKQTGTPCTDNETNPCTHDLRFFLISATKRYWLLHLRIEI
jgi:hypothetical protein